jgi:hypothetical protein
MKDVHLVEFMDRLVLNGFHEIIVIPRRRFGSSKGCVR